MIAPQNSYLSGYFTSKAIITYFGILSVCYILFPYKLPLLWVVFGLTTVLGFFYFTNGLTIKWANTPDYIFQKKIFGIALLIRIIYVLIIFAFYKKVNGNPFEFGAADSISYHEEALWIIDLLNQNNLNYYFKGYLKTVSDSGWPSILSLIYLITFKSIIAIRIFNALIGAWMVVLIYKLAQRNFGETAARISAIMAMLLPTFIFYTGLHLKETIMVFILVAFAERADYLFRSKVIRFWPLFLVILLGFSLFFFRTVLAVTAWFALFTSLAILARRFHGITRRLFFVLWFGLAAMFVFSGRVYKEVETYAEARFENQKSRLSKIATGSASNTLAKFGSSALFLPVMIPAPFPTLVDTGQKNAMMINGSNFTKNIYAFFVLMAFWVLYRRKMLRENILILTMLLSYLVVLAFSGFALSERFHLPLVPFLLIFAGYGVTVTTKVNRKMYVPYLALISILIIGWNWFKLAGRGMI